MNYYCHGISGVPCKQVSLFDDVCSVSGRNMFVHCKMRTIIAEAKDFLTYTYLVDIWYHSPSVTQCVLLLDVVVDELQRYISHMSD
jgi:hypothetical protein